MKSVDQINLRGKTVLLRVDFNCPLEFGTDDETRLLDDTRIRASLPTINYILEQSAKLIIISHLGRPKAKRHKQIRARLSLMPVASRLAELCQQEVLLTEDCVSESVPRLIKSLKSGQILMLENLRFHAGEKLNDSHFAKQLASYADVYINDAFGTLHRNHASTVGVAKEIAEHGVGFLVKKEIQSLSHLLEQPEKPFLALLGGAKVSSKIPVIENLLKHVDSLVIGGGMAYTFLKAQGFKIGQSLIEEDQLKVAERLLERARLKNISVLLPKDHVMVTSLDKAASMSVSSGRDIADDYMGVDIGPQTIDSFAQAIYQAKTLIWNGPMGIFEKSPFDRGTIEIAQAFSESKGFTVVGGGDSVAAMQHCGLVGQVSHISTGGGATLEYLGGQNLPGLVALEEMAQQFVRESAQNA